MRNILLATACLLGGCTQTVAEETPSAAQSGSSTTEGAAMSADALGPMAVYDRLVREAAADENTVYSPTSVSQALGLVHLGAAGETKRQIERFLSIAPGEAGDRALAARASDLGETERGVTVNIANALFLSQDWRFRPAFLEGTSNIYSAAAERADFIREAVTAVMLHGSRLGGVGLRGGGNPVVLVSDKRADAAPPQFVGHH